MSDGVIRPQTSEKPSSPLPVKPIVALRKKTHFPPVFVWFFEKVGKDNGKKEIKKKERARTIHPSPPRASVILTDILSLLRINSSPSPTLSGKCGTAESQSTLNF